MNYSYLDYENQIGKLEFLDQISEKLKRAVVNMRPLPISQDLQKGYPFLTIQNNWSEFLYLYCYFQRDMLWGNSCIERARVIPTNLNILLPFSNIYVVCNDFQIETLFIIEKQIT